MDYKCQPSGDMLSLDDSLRLGCGGEGTIYRLPHNLNLVAKIYHTQKMNAERASKLRAMLANAPDDPVRERGHASIAWPIELVTSLHGNQDIVGFLMPLLQNAHPIFVLYDVTERHVRFPFFTYKHLCRTATNLASAVRAIHRSGYVIGDVNESNILVTERALVTLVDTDSFQVTEQPSGRVYRCPVGSEFFTPPELLGKNFEEIDRSPEHDLFGLAVLFFQLLMEGTRPFAGILSGVPDPPDYFERIAKGYFPYAKNSRFKPSAMAPPFEMLHPRLQELFLQCFVDGHADPRQRPTATMWYHALKESEQELKVCSRNSQHRYFDHCRVCPWCERARRVSQRRPNWDPFPSVDGASAATHYNYAVAQSSANSQQPSFSSPVTGQASVPTPASFSASATTVAFGQAATLQWTVPQAQSVWITNQSGRPIFAGNSASGFVTIYPTKTSTYHLTASGVGVSLPTPLTISVTQVPLPVALKQPYLKLHQPISLREVRGGLLAGISLKEIAVKLRSPSKLKSYLPLSNYTELKRVSVGLKNNHDTP